MVDNYICPFCGVAIPLTKDTHKETHVGFTPIVDEELASQVPRRVLIEQENIQRSENGIMAYVVKCPNCEKTSIYGIGISGDIINQKYLIYPKSNAKQYPEYVPQPIRKDYQEAFEILNISPKASATLSRRCIQGMIRDTQGIHAGNLASEINQLEGKIPPDQWAAIDAARKLGNIGAHMEKDTSIIVDIDPEEANLLLDLVEYLIYEWYISKHESSLMMDKIKQLSEKKEALRRPG